MRWASFRPQTPGYIDELIADGPRLVGFLDGNEIVGVRASGREMWTGSSITSVAKGLPPLRVRFPRPWTLNVVAELTVEERDAFVRGARESSAKVSVPIDQAQLFAPLDPPAGDIVAIGRNYADHAGEMARADGKEPERPTVFAKAQTTVNDPFGDIVIDDTVSTEIDWEVELGVVIGRRCRNVAPQDALQHVFGYTVLNDVTARDIQYGWGGQFFKGKSIDGYCPMGPWIVTADEIPDPQDLELTLRVNGEIKQQGHTRDMIFSIADIVSQLSLGMTLRPGTVIATGTPSGVGYARDPREFLHPGDVMETEISGIGTLRNRVVAASESARL